MGDEFLLERLKPGSPEARAAGCTCDPGLNHDGRGVADPLTSRPLYSPDNDCPLHGLTALAHDLQGVPPGDIGC